MLKYIENLLYEKTKDTQSKILYAQWSYDKKIIPEILQTISNIFPHYSLHDETHSITIINNIVRVLGKENIEKLSAIDLWLILEASYKHDIGMAISAKEIKETLESKDFIDFFKIIAKDGKHSLHEFASQFKIRNGKIKYKKKYLDLRLDDGIKFILAEYYRKEHSKRSKNIIENNNEEFYLGNYETLIPRRIFKILGDICDSHTKNFDHVMNLSFSEVGIDTDDAHPRFIACMLRIGDLLDLDNNRFSDVMLRTLHKIPIETFKHKSKHLSIESFRVDKKIIEIVAKCNDYDVANITQHWFNYLNDEISNQMIKWNEIVPSKDFGYLPTIGNLRVELKKYEFIDGKNKPQFKIDTEKALSLLQGVGIYENSYQSIREILQNSIDATLLRIWIEYGDNKEFNTPNSKDFLELVANYPITIKILKDKTTDKYTKWNIEIVDNGIGIASNELRYLTETGSSSRNPIRERIVDDMPKWMRPSGTFGIGFQSIFMLTNQVTLYTKSFFDEQYKIIELNSPNSKKDGSIFVEKKKTDYKTKVGTKLSFVYKTKKIPNKYSIVRDHRIMKSVVNSYDPIVDESFDIEIASLIDEIILASSAIYIPLELSFNKDNSLVSGINKTKKFDYFSKKESTEISLISNGSTLHQTIVYYKNQLVDKNKLPHFYFLNFEINILSDDASEVLTINRNEIQDRYVKKLRKKLFNTAFDYLTNKYDKFSHDEKILISMFLNYYYEKKDVERFDDWKKLKLKLSDGEYITLKKLLRKINKIEFKNVFNDNMIRIDTSKPNEFKIKDKKFIITTYNNNDEHVIKFIKKIIPKYFNSILLNPKKNNITVMKKNTNKFIKDNHLIEIIKKQKINRFSRVKIPCIGKYKKLRLKDDAYKSWLMEIYVNVYGITIPSMLSPFFYSCKNNEFIFVCDEAKLEYRVDKKLIDWVYRNRYDEKTTREEIITAYHQFKKDFDVEEINGYNN